MKTLITSLFGLDSKLYDRLPTSTRKKYGTKLIALIISVMISNVVAIEISHTVLEISDTKTVVGVCLLWSFFIVAMDVLLIRRAFPPIIRLLFSFAIVSLSAISTLSLITKPDITNKRETEVKKQISKIDSIYNAEKTERYKFLITKQNQQLEYHASVCDPESKRIMAGERYNAKHQHCIKELQEIATLQTDLDTKEQPLKSQHEEKISETRKLNSLGLFELMKQTIIEIWSDGVKIFGFFVVLIVLICLESIVFFTNIRHDTSIYDKLEQTEIANQEEINKAKAANEKATELANEANKNAELLWTIQNEDNRRKRFLEFNSKMENLKLLNHIHTEYTKTKKLQPDMINPNIAKSIEMLISNEIAIVQKGIEDGIDNSSFSTTDTNNSNSEVDNAVNEKQLRNYYTNIFYATTPMKALADRLYNESKGDYLTFAKKVFEWSIENIAYQEQHTLDHYKTAREVYNSKSGICGEQAVFFCSLLKYKGFKPNYIHVDIDAYSEAVNHAVAGIEVNGRTVLVDIAYKTFDISHQRWNKVSDEELVKNMIAWNK